MRHQFPVEMKGSVISSNAEKSYGKNARWIWDEQYALRPALWKGPYDLALITRYLEHGACVLDVGCGTGRYLVPLVRNVFRVVGADFSRQALALLHSRYVRVVADIEQLPFPDNSFDAVTCYGVLQHLANGGRNKAVVELFRVLKHEGVAIVEVTGRKDMRYNHGKRIAAHAFLREKILNYYFSLLELRELFNHAGFFLISANEKIIKKRHNGAVRKRHRILVALRKP